MKAIVLWLCVLSVLGCGTTGLRASLELHRDNDPIQRKDVVAFYSLAEPSSVKNAVVRFSMTMSGPTGASTETWFRLLARKGSGDTFSFWLLGDGFPSADVEEATGKTQRYVIQKGASQPIEFRDAFSDSALLPVLGGWRFMIPQLVGDTLSDGVAERVHYLGHEYRLISIEPVGENLAPMNPRTIRLRSSAFIGFPHNTRQREDQRRFDRSDYEYVRLTQEDYQEMLAAGINCVNVDAEQLPWVAGSDTYYWGVGGADVDYPECLYRSNYLGPAIFLDEPMVGTRDHVIRPKLRSDPQYRSSITPLSAYREFVDYFAHSRGRGAPSRLVSGLAARDDVALGEVQFEQEHVYSWETMVSSASYQLSAFGTRPPKAIVFEPPGRFGTRRTLPEMNMTYGCQIPADNPKNLASIIYGFLRGAARATGKDWGMSLYGAVDRADTFWFQTHAYDLGATHFYFWDTYQLACVPYEECLALARNLSAHAASHPKRNLDRLQQAATVAVVLPLGYNLGHVQMGKGSLWGVGELNLERTNSYGVPYREVMRNVFVEIERCLRLGVAFDLFWDLESLSFDGYNEVVRVREDGTVAIQAFGGTTVLNGARVPTRPRGDAPELDVVLATDPADRSQFVARAQIREFASPIFYTLGTDSLGRYQNVYAAWEIYGPQPEDYRFLREEGDQPPVKQDGDLTELEIRFRVDQPGRYRLRVATADLAGRSRVVWHEFDVPDA